MIVDGKEIRYDAGGRRKGREEVGEDSLGVWRPSPEERGIKLTLFVAWPLPHTIPLKELAYFMPSPDWVTLLRGKLSSGANLSEWIRGKALAGWRVWGLKGEGKLDEGLWETKNNCIGYEMELENRWACGAERCERGVFMHCPATLIYGADWCCMMQAPHFPANVGINYFTILGASMLNCKM